MFGEERMICGDAPLNQILHFHSVWEEKFWSLLLVEEVVCLKRKPFLALNGDNRNAPHQTTLITHNFR